MKTLLLYLMSVPAIAQTLVPAAAQSEGFPVWLGIVIVGAIIVGGFVYLKRKDPAAAAKIEGSLYDLLHKQADAQAITVATNAQLANVVASAPVQEVVNRPSSAVSTSAQPPVNSLYMGKPRLDEFVYPDEPDYKREGNEPPWGWVPVLRTQQGLPRRDRGNENYHEGDRMGKAATPEQMELLRTNWNSALPEEVRTAARAALMTSLGYPGATGEMGTPAQVALARLVNDNPEAAT